MRAGELRHRITIEAPMATQNAFGEPIEGWTTVADVWASREDLSGREAFLAMQTMAEVTTRFRMRYRDGVNATMRILSDGSIYRVTSVADPDGTRRSLVILTAREG